MATFKEFQNLLESQPDYTTSQQSEMLQRLTGKPFWIWENTVHRDKNRTHRGDCCFTDIIGRPGKNGFADKLNVTFDNKETVLELVAA